MVSRRTLITLIILGAALIAGISFYGMRKKLPYDFELVPVRQGLVVLNTTSWSNRDLIVSCQAADGSYQPNVIMKGSLNECEIPDLDVNTGYTIRIRRADLVGRLRYRSWTQKCVIPETPQQYVVLVGASVGKSWNLPSLPDRINANGFVYGYRAKYGYDKTNVIESLIDSRHKPDMVIIKECAAYFPKECDKIIEKIPSWTDMLAKNGIVPVLATCCPVTRANDMANPGRQEAINKFNAFIRDYAGENELSVLDLAGALQVSGDSHFLRDEFAQPDGLHLLPGAYRALDAIVLSALQKE